MKKSLTKKERLLKRQEISSLFSDSKKEKSGDIILFYRKNSLDYSRFLITYKKKFGNAVCRNKNKRICREIIRLCKDEFICSYDCIFLLQKSSFYYFKRERQIKSLFQKIGMLKM